MAPQLSEALRKYLDVISPDTEEIIKRYERARVRYDAFRTEVDAAEARQEGMDRLGKIKFNRDEAEMDMMRLQQVGRPLLPRRRRRRRPSKALPVLRCLSRRLPRLSIRDERMVRGDAHRSTPPGLYRGRRWASSSHSAETSSRTRCTRRWRGHGVAMRPSGRAGPRFAAPSTHSANAHLQRPSPTRWVHWQCGVCGKCTTMYTLPAFHNRVELMRTFGCVRHITSTCVERLSIDRRRSVASVDAQ
eukprot:COSAG01_NODE_7056_length_3374_cov_1.996336_2_plen_246_part_00